MINIFENIGEKIAKMIALSLFRLGIRPVVVTIARFVFAAPISIYFFTRGTYLFNIIGLILYISLAVFDWVDGEMAQLYKLPKETAPLGKLIDQTSDRVLVLIVLGSIFYAYSGSSEHVTWSIISILYYSIFFFSTTLHNEFNNRFNLDYDSYPNLEKQITSINPSLNFLDKILLGLICVHKNSFTKFCFSVSYPLLVGIFLNQLQIAFIFITIMSTIRSLGLFVILFRALGIDKSNLILINVLRKYKV